VVEEILVFRGTAVRYIARFMSIKCESDDECFEIAGIHTFQVAGRPAYAHEEPVYGLILEGNELWSDGNGYIIKYNPLFDKNQIKPPIIRGRER